MSKISYYSKEAFDNLKKDLEHLCNVERPKISDQIAQARDKGDLSENAEYDAAKEAQGLLEMRISEMEEKLLYARILDTSQLDDSKILNMMKERDCTVSQRGVELSVPVLRYHQIGCQHSATRERKSQIL